MMNSVQALVVALAATTLGCWGGPRRIHTPDGNKRVIGDRLADGDKIADGDKRAADGRENQRDSDGPDTEKTAAKTTGGDSGGKLAGDRGFDVATTTSARKDPGDLAGRGPGRNRGVHLPGLDGRQSPETRAAIARHLEGARRALEQGQFERALAESRALLRRDSAHGEALAIMATALMQKGFDERARTVLEAATKRTQGPGSAKLWMLLGLAYERDDPDRAHEAYKRATEVRPDYAKAWTNLGALCLVRGKYAEASSALETALSLEPNSRTALTDLGTAYRRRGLAAKGPARAALLRRAESQYLTVVRQHPDYAPAHFNLGVLYLDADPFPDLDTLTRLETAVRHFKRFEKLGWKDKPLTGSAAEYLEEASRALKQAHADGESREERNSRRKKRKHRGDKPGKGL